MTEKNSRTSLFMFQALAGFFGFAWMLSIPASIILIVLSLFWGWSWAYVFYAIVVGGLAKWLLRGFRDNYERCRLEQWLINTHGYTKEQSYRIWFNAYGSGGGDGHNRVLSIYTYSKDLLDKLKV